MYSSPAETELHKIAVGTIDSCHMLEHGDRIAVGVSGGADSVALLTFLCTLREPLSLEIIACHVNHSLRGAESNGDAEFVRSLCEKLRVEYRLCTFDAAGGSAGSGMGVEEFSREKRYSFFRECAGDDGKIATAHTLSDAVETVIFNMVRGTGVKGLCGIPKVREGIIRPLRDCTREQVEAYLAEAGQDYRTDSTNSSDAYSRNYIRHNLVPAMLRLNPSLHTAMSRMMEQMEQQWLMTAKLANEARDRITAGELTFDREKFLALPQPVSAVLLQEWLDTAGAERSGRLMELMYRYASAGSGGVELASGVRFMADRDYIKLICEAPVCKPFCSEVKLPSVSGESACCRLNDGRILRITMFIKKNIEITEKLYNKDLKNFADCDKIKEPVFIHEPRKQDTICLQDRQHNVISRYRTGNRGLTKSAISRMAVAEDALGLVWAERLGCDQGRVDNCDGAGVYLFEVLEDSEE